MQQLTGFRTLLGFALRRDRWRLPLWIVFIWASAVGTAASFPLTYPDAQARLGALLTINNPGTTALIGAVYGEGEYTYGVMVGHQLLGLLGVCTALMSIFTLVRHTRAEEESERAELLRAGVVGRFAPTAAALCLVIAANVIVAGGVGLGLAGLGISTIDLSGSMLFGSAIGAVGIFFAGIASVTLQVTEHARTASSIVGLILATSYVVRAIGDVSAPALSRLSPIGWAQATETYADNHWWPVPVLLVGAGLFFLGGLALERRRDLGAGLLSSRGGRAYAGVYLRGPISLTWRLHRGTIFGWSLGLAIFGLLYGPVLSEAEAFLQDLPIMAEFLPDVRASGAELFGALVIAVTSVLAAVPPLQVILRMRSEETSGRVGPLLASPLSRLRWVLAGVLVAVLTGVISLSVLGLGIGVGAAWSMNDWSWVGGSWAAAVSYLPAVLVIISVALVLLGWIARFTQVAWVPVVFAAVVLYFGGLLDFPQWLMDVSPYTHVPQMPAYDFSVTPLLWLTALAFVLGGIGVFGVRRRDMDDS